MDKQELHRHDGLRLMKDAGKLFLDPYYTQFLPPIVDLVKAAKDRSNYKEPLKHLGMQIALLRSLQKLEEASSTGKKDARAQGSKELELQSTRNKYLSKAIKEIADGVTWRTLGFSRFTMRILSQGRYAGHTWGKQGQEMEVKHATAAARNGAFMILNDVTNCVRIGDLLMVRPKLSLIPYITEVKKKELVTPSTISRKLDRNMKLDKQEMRLMQAQLALEKHAFPGAESDIPVDDVIVPLHDVISGVGATAKQALRKGAASRMLTPYMRVEVLDLAQLSKLDYRKVLSDLYRPDDSPLLNHSNYDHLVVGASGESERASPPYTIFPLPAEVIARMITGQLLVTCALYRKPLEDAFLALGWELVIDDKAFEQYDPATEMEIVEEQSDIVLFPTNSYEKLAELMWLKHPSGFKISAFELVVGMAREYTTVKHVVAVAQYFYSKAIKGQNAYTYHEIKDGRRWS